jgi:hypothetical protein
MLTRTGQSTLELAILVGSVAAALVAMGIYLQRGYQGYLRNTSQSHGVQFDPSSPFAESRTLNAYTRNQEIDITSAEASVPSLGGPLPGRMLTTKVNTVTEWDMARSAAYDAK